MNYNDKTKLPHRDKRLEFVAMMLREMRISDGKRQNDYNEKGISRRQLQRAESGNNISLRKLMTILDLHGYNLSDVDWNNS